MGKFILKSTTTGFKFDLLAGNNEVIGTSEVYTSKTAALHGIESVRKNAEALVEDQTLHESLKHPKYELYTDASGEFRFRLKAVNGEVILSSEGYKAKASAKKGILSVGNNAPHADVSDISEK